MKKTKRINRVRMFRCPYCQYANRVQRKSPGEDVALSTCHSCFRAVMNNQVETWLASPLPF